MPGARTTLMACLGVLLLAGWAAPVRADNEPAPLLWVAGTEPPLFVAGTLHVGDAEVVRLHPLVQAAFDRSTRVLTELDFREDVDGQAQARACLPRGRCLRRILAPGLYRRTARAASQAGHSLPCLDCRKVWVIYLLLDAATCTPGGGEEPLDRRLQRLALEAGKQVTGLESVDEQLAVFDALRPREQAQLLLTAIRRVERRCRAGLPLASERGARLKALYLAGDAEGLLAESERLLGCQGALQQRLVRTLFHERNERMARRAMAQVEAHDGGPLFMAVGAAHLGGSRGVIARLRERGIAVRRVRSLADVAPTPLQAPSEVGTEPAGSVPEASERDESERDESERDESGRDESGRDESETVPEVSAAPR